MLNIHFRLDLQDDLNDTTWNNTAPTIVTYALIIYFLVSGPS